MSRNEGNKLFKAGVFLGAILCVMLVAASGGAQQPPSEPSQLVEQAIGLAVAGKPLAGVKLLESAPQDDIAVASILATLRVFAGDTAGALRGIEKSYPPAREDKRPFAERVTPTSAIDAIVEEARHHRIVVINEAHHASQHRAFILRLLPRLRELGFSYYAAEAIAEDGKTLKSRGYPVRETGFYTNDHVFGDVVRQALALGLVPVAYEATDSQATSNDPIDDINLREQEQCRNLVERIFAKDAKARVILHVGFDHAMEKPKKEGGREIHWLAARLAAATGEDPLTIDQTEHSERGLGKESSPWKLAQSAGWLVEPIVLKRDNGDFHVSGHFAGLVDMQVLHPPTKWSDGRPDWLHSAGRSAFELPAEIQAQTGRLLAQVFVDSEGEDAVPFDRVILAPNAARPKLLLAPGKYRIVVQDEQGMEIKRVKLAWVVHPVGKTIPQKVGEG